MYVLLLLIVVLASALAVRSFLIWAFPEAIEDGAEAVEPQIEGSSFYDPRTWLIFQPIPLLSYRRDKRGRFRKMP